MFSAVPKDDSRRQTKKASTWFDYAKTTPLSRRIQLALGSLHKPQGISILIDHEASSEVRRGEGEVALGQSFTVGDPTRASSHPTSYHRTLRKRKESSSAFHARSSRSLRRAQSHCTPPFPLQPVTSPRPAPGKTEKLGCPANSTRTLPLGRRRPSQQASSQYPSISIPSVLHPFNITSRPRRRQNPFLYLVGVLKVLELVVIYCFSPSFLPAHLLLRLAPSLSESCGDSHHCPGCASIQEGPSHARSTTTSPSPSQLHLHSAVQRPTNKHQHRTNTGRRAVRKPARGRLRIPPHSPRVPRNGRPRIRLWLTAGRRLR